MRSIIGYAVSLTLLMCTIAVHAQDQTKSFVIDQSKWYVYLKFDHIGTRKPLSQREPNKGIWLRLVNNCAVPIIVAVFDPRTSDPGVGLYDQVVPVDLNAPPILHGFRKGEIPSQTDPSPQEQPPEGYLTEESLSTKNIPPGTNLLFSVPVNHVGRSWYLKVEFYLDVPNSSYGIGPTSFVSFGWQDVPEKFRPSLLP